MGRIRRSRTRLRDRAEKAAGRSSGYPGWSSGRCSRYPRERNSRLPRRILLRIFIMQREKRPAFLQEALRFGNAAEEVRSAGHPEGTSYEAPFVNIDEFNVLEYRLTSSNGHNVHENIRDREGVHDRAFAHPLI